MPQKLGFGFAFVLLVLSGSVLAQNWAEQDKAILSDLRNKKFQELDKRLSSLYEAYLADPLREREVDRAIDTFYRADPTIGRWLSEWVDTSPKSYIARLARGVHYTKSGWSRRGSAVAVETSQEKMDGMQYYFEKAHADFEIALVLNPKLIHVMCYQMEILMNLGGKDAIEGLKARALGINPLSLTARWYYLTTIMPRWGGSHAAMLKEVNSAKPLYARNSALRVLEGRVDADRGDRLLFAGNYEASIPYYTKSLSYGEHAFYFGQRGEAYSYANQPALSNADLETALRLRPNLPRAAFIRGFNDYAAGKYMSAINYWDFSLQADPYEAKTWNLRGDAYLRVGNVRSAYRNFAKAIELEPDNQEYLMDLERARVAGGTN